MKIKSRLSVIIISNVRGEIAAFTLHRNVILYI